MEAVLPSASSTGSPIMCTVRTPPSGRRTRNSPSMGLASIRQSVTIAVSLGRSSSRTREGSSSRVRGSAAGSRPRIWYSSPDQLASSVRRFHSALPTRLRSESRRGAVATAATAGSVPAVSGASGRGCGPSRSWAKCSSRSLSWCIARSYSARCQRPCGSVPSAGVSRRTASTSPLSCRVCVMSASTEPRAGGWAAGRSAERWGGMTHSDEGTVRPRLTEDRLRLLHSLRRPVRDLATHETVVLLAYATVFLDGFPGTETVRVRHAKS